MLLGFTALMVSAGVRMLREQTTIGGDCALPSGEVNWSGCLPKPSPPAPRSGSSPGIYQRAGAPLDTDRNLSEIAARDALIRMAENLPKPLFALCTALEILRLPTDPRKRSPGAPTGTCRAPPRRAMDQARLILDNLPVIEDDLAAAAVVILGDKRLRIRTLPLPPM